MRIKKFISFAMALVIFFSAFLNSVSSAAEAVTVGNDLSEHYYRNELNASGSDTIGSQSTVSTPFFIVLVRENPKFFSKVKTVFFVGTKVTVMGFSGNYCKVKNRSGTEGYVFSGWLNGGKKGELSLNRDYDHVYVGATNNTRVKASYNGSGEVRWSSSDTSIFTVDSTGKVTGKKPGKATLTASVGVQKESCTVYCVYPWKKAWTGKAFVKTEIKNGFESSSGTLCNLPKNAQFTVSGDDGGSGGWAYGKCTVNQKEYWGFVRIEDISTKGTVSQYNSMGWLYPVKDIKNGISQSRTAKYISSPYGWRDTNPQDHKGIDITNGISSNSNLSASIDGYQIVSAFDGKVIYVCTNSEKSCGYCVAVRSSKADPVSGKYFVAIYMHMKTEPAVDYGQEVKVGEILGKVGNTGNSVGSHLHFEVNNQNLSYGQKIYYEDDSDKEIVFGGLINPLFIYMDYYELSTGTNKITINSGAEAMKYKGAFWYGDDNKTFSEIKRES